MDKKKLILKRCEDENKEKKAHLKEINIFRIIKSDKPLYNILKIR